MEVSYFLAFVTGVISFFAPCVVPLLPAYVSYITGVSVKELKEHQFNRAQVLLNALIFVCGFSSVFVILGTTAASLSLVFHQQKILIQLLGGFLIIGFAIQLLGWLKIPALMKEYRLQMPEFAQKAGLLKPFFLGVVFATAWTPCVGAVLGSILTLAASSQTASYGASLLFVYSIGIGLPFLITALFLSEVTGWLKQHARFLERINQAAGWLLLILGLLLINNTLHLGGGTFTYDNVNAKLFELAFSLGYEIR